MVFNKLFKEQLLEELLRITTRVDKAVHQFPATPWVLGIALSRVVYFCIFRPSRKIIRGTLSKANKYKIF